MRLGLRPVLLDLPGLRPLRFNASRVIVAANTTGPRAIAPFLAPI
ncbi:hypothetical protein AKJ09_07525 [Labilithrix luteola]|uniref:Uncharacterized protein n=1 Tax=Labilithrix luteola TaxID=1391654 RepID=A0A0K1Q5D2_9BACT|nr:hypothetical protein AKJ09_07525 [Labilithrix luteola]